MTSPDPVPQSAPLHYFHAVAFVENFRLKEIAASYPEAERKPYQLSYRLPSGGEIFIFAFGAVVSVDVPPFEREQEMVRFRQLRPDLSPPTVIPEELAVRVDPDAAPEVVGDLLTLDRLTHPRASVIALTVGQSAAMEYYERIVDEMFERTDRLVQRLERYGTVSLSTRPLHRFIGAAIGARSEVLSVLHLLDKPEEAWEDPGIDRIYGKLRAQFDLGDRHQALELKLRGIQEALELLLDTARDRRLVLLEIAIVLLFVLDIVLSLVRS